MTKFEAFKDQITNAAKASFPEWVTFEYENDFPGYNESFVYESVCAIKKMGELEVRNNEDRYFSVKFISA